MPSFIRMSVDPVSLPALTPPTSKPMPPWAIWSDATPVRATKSSSTPPERGVRHEKGDFALFGLFKKKKKDSEPQFIVVTINARIQPMHRLEIYEEPLDEILARNSVGEVSGGGTLLSETGEVEYCDVEIQVTNSSNEVVDLIKTSLEKMGVPKGSTIKVEATEKEIQFGSLEGLALYLNGTDLDDEVYANSDSNHVYSELDRLTQGIGNVYSYWQGPTETAFYLYGTSFSQMKSKIAELVDNYPLCQKCRIEKIA